MRSLTQRLSIIRTAMSTDSNAPGPIGLAEGATTDWPALRRSQPGEYIQPPTLKALGDRFTLTYSGIATKRWRVGRTQNRSFAMIQFEPFYFVSRRNRSPPDICQLSAHQRG
jgi:hypothetical protein